MRLRAWTGLEREKLENEHKELLAKIAELKAILADEKLLLGVIREEIQITALEVRWTTEGAASAMMSMIFPWRI